VTTKTPEQDLQDDADAGVLPTAREKKLQDAVAGYERVIKNLNLRQWVVQQGVTLYAGLGVQAETFERVIKIIDTYVVPPSDQ
jgi:hypothetical protein